MTFSGSIGIVGTGNAATHFAKAFFANGMMVKTIYARSQHDGIALAKEVNASFKHTKDLASASEDVVLLAVSDQSIQALSKLLIRPVLVLHCSGATPLSAISTNRAGVLYPLQTMSKGKAVNFSNIPMLLECNSETDKNILTTLANSLTKHVVWMNSEKRLKLHLAAVFACNFANYMMAAAQNYLAKEHIPFDLLHHLIQETAEKAIALGPSKAQTGPALRGDQLILNQHEALLENDDELLHLYQTISNLIKTQHELI